MNSHKLDIRLGREGHVIKQATECPCTCVCQHRRASQGDLLECKAPARRVLWVVLGGRLFVFLEVPILGKERVRVPGRVGLGRVLHVFVRG
jgi:hypothetical protein